jgi:hypothetical protein
METNMNRKLHATLALVAVVSFGLYILGCVGYAAWNADGSKLLVPYYAPQAKECGVVLYDLKTHASRKLMARSGVNQDAVAMQVQWVKGATEPFIVVASDKIGSDDVRHLDAYVVPVNGGAIRNWVLPNIGDNVPVGPFPELNGKIFIPSSSIGVIDLQDGKSSSVNYEEKEDQIVALATDGRRIFYVREARRPAPTTEAPDARESGGIQFGELGFPDLKRVPYFELFSGDLESQGVELTGMELVAERAGTRLAMLGTQGGKDAVLIFSSARLDRTVVPRLPSNECKLGSFIWAHADTMYAVVGCPAAEGIMQISAAEISVNDGATRLTRVVRVSSSGDVSDNFEQRIKVSLAPNGRLLAVTTTVLTDSDVTRDNRALFIIDMKSPDRHVTKLAIAGVTQTAGR